MILRPCPSQLEREVLVTVDSCTWPQLRRSDRVIGADWSWSQRDEAMASRILAASVPGTRTLAVAGNAHTATSHTELGVPMGARLASRRPGLQEIRITYGSGSFWNFEPRQFASRIGPEAMMRLYLHDGALALDLPVATEAVVPQRPQPMRESP
jgi:hypothetical protein